MKQMKNIQYQLIINFIYDIFLLIENDRNNFILMF